MPKRNRPGLSENTRKRIQTTMIAERLTKHVLGDVEMTATQVTAALGLLRKTLPDLQQQEIKAEVNQKTRVVSNEPLTEDEWSDQYGSDLAATSGTTESVN